MNVASALRCDDVCNDLFIENFLHSVAVKELWKSVKILQRYRQEFGVIFMTQHLSMTSQLRQQYLGDILILKVNFL